MAQTMLQNPDHALTPAKLAVISKATLAACDKSDGLEDGLVGDPRTCKFDPLSLLCKNGDGPDCLTKGQVETAKAIYTDFKAPNGDTVYGYPIGHEAGMTGWQQWITGANAPAAEEGKTTTTFGGRHRPAIASSTASSATWHSSRTIPTTTSALLMSRAISRRSRRWRRSSARPIRT